MTSYGWGSVCFSRGRKHKTISLALSTYSRSNCCFRLQVVSRIQLSIAFTVSMTRMSGMTASSVVARPVTVRSARLLQQLRGLLSCSPCLCHFPSLSDIARVSSTSGSDTFLKKTHRKHTLTMRQCHPAPSQQAWELFLSIVQPSHPPCFHPHASQPPSSRIVIVLVLVQLPPPNQ